MPLVGRLFELRWYYGAFAVATLIPITGYAVWRTVPAGSRTESRRKEREASDRAFVLDFEVQSIEVDYGIEAGERTLLPFAMLRVYRTEILGQLNISQYSFSTVVETALPALTTAITPRHGRLAEARG
jgi:hypothetical protein